jgi:hypothetical protein
MTVTAILSIVFGGIEILNGLFQLAGAFVFMYELLRMGAGLEIPVARLAFALVVLTAGVIGIIAGVRTFSARMRAEMEPGVRRAAASRGRLLVLSRADHRVDRHLRSGLAER